MGQINFKPKDEVHRKFKMVVGRKYGFEKGYMRICLNEAMEKWLEYMKKAEPKLFEDLDEKIKETKSKKTNTEIEK